jgi:7-cyano-7-deazaguanine synthase in queuosine biosynthesis
MTAYAARTDLTRDVRPGPGAAVLDWAPGSPAATIDCGTGFFGGWRPSRPAADLLVLAAAVYCADKASPRSAAPDAWTRQLSLQFPALDPATFDPVLLQRMLGFLTGDDWALTAYEEPADPCAALGPLAAASQPAMDVDAVSLFSGGLDSLCGVIDLLEGDPELRLGLVAHYDGGQASSKQPLLHARLVGHYGAARVQLRRLWLRPAPLNPARANPGLPVVETTTRSRSFLFLAAALALASSCGTPVPVYIPENGYIALNVPLTRARAGSASTRTTHPYYLDLLRRAALAAGVPNPVINPCGYFTKGEMLRGSRNPGLLRQLAKETVSCSHPEAARMQQREQGNCGYCFPCLIRRAALAAVGWDTENPAWDALTNPRLAEATGERRGADLRAVVNGVFADRPDSDVLRNAPLPQGTHADHLSVWRRGNAELRTWIQNGAQGPLAEIIGRLP